MGRQRTTNDNLPTHMTVVNKPNGSKYYYYDLGTAAPKRYLALGSDYVHAIQKWVELEGGNARQQKFAFSFGDLAKEYKEKGIPQKAVRTQKDYKSQLKNLLKFFEDGQLSAIRPIHVVQYREWRNKAPVQANREIALLSSMWNVAREWGMTDLPKPS